MRDWLVRSPVFKTGVGREERPRQVRFLCISAEARGSLANWVGVTLGSLFVGVGAACGLGARARP